MEENKKEFERTLEECIKISRAEYEEYHKLKGYYCRVWDYYVRIRMLSSRLAMLQEFFDAFDSENYSKEDIECNIDATIMELYAYLKRYEKIILSLDLPEDEGNANIVDLI